MNMMISYQELVRTFPKLLCRLEKASGEKEQKHYNALIGLLFE